MVFSTCANLQRLARCKHQSGDGMQIYKHINISHNLKYSFSRYIFDRPTTFCATLHDSWFRIQLLYSARVRFVAQQEQTHVHTPVSHSSAACFVGRQQHNHLQSTRIVYNRLRSRCGCSYSKCFPNHSQQRLLISLWAMHLSSNPNLWSERRVREKLGVDYKVESAACICLRPSQ